MKRIVIIGAGGHGREVAEILHYRSEQDETMPALGFIDEDQSLRDQLIDNLPVLGDWSWFDGVDRSEIAVICASGFSKTRKQMVEKARRYGLSFANAIFPSSYVSPAARIGEGVVICQSGVACRGTTIGDHVIINLGAIVSHDTQLGDYSTLNPGVNLAGNVVVGEGCYLGIGCSVIQGINIGAWTTVGAGTSVIRDLPAHVTAVGVPAKIIKRHQDTE
jgi:sugar O-acyltransferase (sialic acid O-acetyltransferase NeuD family)